MGDFTIDGSATAVRARATSMRSKGHSFVAVATDLSAITTGGWTGRAARHFEDKFAIEPGRWRDAGEAFRHAANALDAYAVALERAQAKAAAAQELDRHGESLSAQHALDLSDARARAFVSLSSGLPAHLETDLGGDPGVEVRARAAADVAAARSSLLESAEVVASSILDACAQAPAKQRWLAKVGVFFGHVGEGVVEAGKGLLGAIDGLESVVGADPGIEELLHPDLTAEELAARHDLSVEQATDFLALLVNDPAGVRDQLVRGLLDVDTWVDDPGRALGHLIPDLLLAAMTEGGSLAGKIRLSLESAAEGGLSDSRAVRRLAETTLRSLDDIPTPPQGTWRSFQDPPVQAWADEVVALHPELSRRVC